MVQLRQAGIVQHPSRVDELREDFGETLAQLLRHTQDAHSFEKVARGAQLPVYGPRRLGMVVKQGRTFRVNEAGLLLFRTAIVFQVRIVLQFAN